MRLHCDGDGVRLYCDDGDGVQGVRLYCDGDGV